MMFRVAAALTALFLAVGVASAADETRPNVLFIAVDDLNDWIGSLGGHPQTKTPNLDRLAKRGVNFTRAYCSAPACNPSRASLMSGLRPATTGVYHNNQPWRPAMPKAVTLGELFRKHGYESVGYGKIFHGRFNDERGWDEYESPEDYPKPSPEVANDPHSRAGGIVFGKLDASDEEMGDFKNVSKGIAYLGKKHDKPFFLACGLTRPHMPWQVPAKYYDMFPLESIQLPEVPDDDLKDIPAAGLKVAKPQGDHATVLRTENWRQAVQAYLASIAFADAQIGRLIDGLDNSDYADNTIVILWGDHGWHLGEKQHWRKFALWEEATRAPLMMSVPGMTEAGGVCERPIEFVHVYPTLAELCGLKPPSNLDGKSFVSLLEDPAAKWDAAAVTTHGKNNHAVRTEKWRYIRYADGSEELYDHESDPNEWTNLAIDSKHRGTVDDLRTHLPQTNADDAPDNGRSEEGGRPGRRRNAQNKTGATK
ncbi:MAG: sulfatase [Planctomycetaceae bacterium]|nr:sulfatase [Planctomycetaceae bacterium]